MRWPTSPAPLSHPGCRESLILGWPGGGARRPPDAHAAQCHAFPAALAKLLANSWFALATLWMFFSALSCKAVISSEHWRISFSICHRMRPWKMRYDWLVLTQSGQACFSLRQFASVCQRMEGGCRPVGFDPSLARSEPCFREPSPSATREEG